MRHPWLAATLALAAACSSGHHHTAASTTTTLGVPPSTTVPMSTTVSPTTFNARPCRFEQLAVEPTGTGVATGDQYQTNYELRNTGAVACSLAAHLTVELLDQTGHVLFRGDTSGRQGDTDTVLVTPATPATFGILWHPQAPGGFPCPTPVVTPATIRVQFTQLAGRWFSATATPIAVCDDQIYPQPLQKL